MKSLEFTAFAEMPLGNGTIVDHILKCGVVLERRCSDRAGRSGQRTRNPRTAGHFAMLPPRECVALAEVLPEQRPANATTNRAGPIFRAPVSRGPLFRTGLHRSVRGRELNPRHPGYWPGALPIELPLWARCERESNPLLQGGALTLYQRAITAGYRHGYDSLYGTHCANVCADKLRAPRA